MTDVHFPLSILRATLFILGNFCKLFAPLQGSIVINTAQLIAQQGINEPLTVEYLMKTKGVQRF